MPRFHKKASSLKEYPFNTTTTLHNDMHGRRESNPQPSDLESDALPIELRP